MISRLLVYSQSSETPFPFCECCTGELPDCRNAVKVNREAEFEQDLDDIAASVMKVMSLCGLKACQVKGSEKVIKRYFRHFDEIRLRIDRVPRKRFSKENFLHDLAVECGFNRMDSQMAYGIVKRAFRAFYHGSGEEGRRIEALANQMRHRSECFWVVAAQKTAEIYAAYAGLMYSEQKRFEEYIEYIYVKLYAELSSRLHYEVSAPKLCQCKRSAPDSVASTTGISVGTVLTTELFFNNEKFQVSNPPSAVSISTNVTRVDLMTASVVDAPRAVFQSYRVVSVSNTSIRNKTKHRPRKDKKKLELKCSCRHLRHVEDIRPPVITAESSQGPYICRWLPCEEEFPEHCVPCPPLDVICHPYVDDGLPCDLDCDCTCHVCTCSTVDDFIEEEHNEVQSSTGLEDQDTDFCWLASFGDKDSLSEQQRISTVTEEEPELEETKLIFLAPLKSETKLPSEESLPEQQLLKLKQPPYGVSLSTYRCWNTSPQLQEEEPQLDYQPCPFISLSSAPQNQPQSELPKVNGITVDVTVKTQHYPNPADNGKKGKAKGKGSKKQRGSSKEQTLNLNPIEVETRKQNGLKNTVVPPTPNPVPVPVPTPPSKVETKATPRESDEKLTKEDVLKLLGLSK